MNLLEQKLSNRWNCSTCSLHRFLWTFLWQLLAMFHTWKIKRRLENFKSEVNFTGADVMCFHLLLIECTELCYREIYVGDYHMNWTAVNSLLIDFGMCEVMSVLTGAFFLFLLAITIFLNISIYWERLSGWRIEKKCFQLPRFIGYPSRTEFEKMCNNFWLAVYRFKSYLWRVFKVAWKRWKRFPEF